MALPKYRGALAAFYPSFLSFGLCFGLLAGYFTTDLKVLAWILSAPAVMLSFLSIFVVETPFWLVEQGKIEEAEKVLRKIRGPNYDTNQEMAGIVTKKRSKDGT